MMRTFELDDQVLDENEPFQKFLTDTACAIRSTCLTAAQQATSAQLVFGRDMVLQITKLTEMRLQEENRRELMRVMLEKIGKE